VLALALAGCDGVQSSLAPQGPEAARVFILFLVLTVGGAVILIGVIALTAIGLFARPRWRERLGNETLVIGLGLLFPIITLTALLAYGLTMTGATLHPPMPGAPLRVSVVGEQWWWRVVYRDGGRSIESANELRLPVDRPVEIELGSADVIHSFWVPKLAGKLDMIPGRTTKLRLSVTTPGVSRGQCAEYCGGAHALMAFYVVALPPPEFEDWLAREASPAMAAASPEAMAGELLFMSHGCGACHRVRGTAAVGSIGPDLTHVGSRMSLAAATLPNDAAAFARWIVDNQHVKPQNRMPAFRIFSETELRALSVYLANLK
jgi:cytochrome c oxidase subunit 2